MTHLINGSDLDQWADRPESKFGLPLLVRRLIALSVNETTEYTVRAEAGVQYGGWDGVVRNAGQGQFQVPQGDSLWEFGCDKAIKTKANEDYIKRTKDPIGITTGKCTYVFVTPRNWAGRDVWAKEKSAEGKWKGVIALDADSLKTWLELIPSVHVWATELLGRPIQGLSSLENWWNIWRQRTNPAITDRMMLCGRSRTKEDIMKWYKGSVGQVSVISGTVEEAAAVLAASITAMEPQIADELTARTLKVSKGAPLTGALIGRTSAVLVVEQDDAERVRLEVGPEHRIVALGNETIETGQSIETEKIDPRELYPLLVAENIPESDASDLAALARRSFQAFRRQIALNPDGLRPEWAKNAADRHFIISIILAQRWNGADGSADRDAISEMADGIPYPEIEEKCRRLSSMEDPPIRQVGSQWSVISLLDAWRLTQAQLTTDQMNRFERVALRVLSEEDPKFDIPAADRIYAFFDSKGQRRYSDALRKGMADSLAMLSVNGNITSTKRDSTPDVLPKRITESIFDHQRLTERSWYSLSALLPDLAEANPGAFLAACENDLNGKAPLLYRLYVESNNVFMSSSPHIHVLWALERLAWHPEYIKRASVILARLAKKEKPGRNGNSATASLGHVFLAWIRYTGASVSQKITALDGVRRSQCAEQAWTLMIGLLPSGGGFASSTVKPSWAEWVPTGPERYSPKEYHEYLIAVIDRLLEDAGDSLVKLGELLGKFQTLPPGIVSAIVDRLLGIEPPRKPETERQAIVDSLREIVARHRTHKDAEWAVSEDGLQPLLKVIEWFSPTDPVLGNVWLFKHWVQLPDGERDDFHANEKAVEEARCVAMRNVLSFGGLTSVRALASKVEVPRFVGSVLAKPVVFSAEYQDEVTLLLKSESAFDQSLALGYAWSRFRIDGLIWLVDAMARMRPLFNDSQLALLALESDHTPEVWNLIDQYGGGVSAEYWKRIYIFRISDDHALAAAHRLIENGRPFSAVHVLGNLVAHKRNLPSGPESLKTMLAACDGDIANDQLDSSFAWALEHLLDYVAQQMPQEIENLGKIEWVLLPSLNHHMPDRGPKYLFQYLGEHPELFVELVSLIYQSATQHEPPKDPPTEGERNRATRAYQLLDGWRSAPGLKEDGTLDSTVFKAWVNDARERLAKADRASIGDLVLGQVLSGSPPDSDGCWPGSIIRSLIEELQSDSLERGLANGRFNGRGVVTKGCFDGGAQEHALADQYNKWADMVSVDHPRTAVLLREMSRSYSHDGNREDRNSEFQLDGFK